jgi:hypothetical protein
MKHHALGSLILVLSLLILAGCGPGPKATSPAGTPSLDDLVATAVQATALHSGAATPAPLPTGAAQASPTARGAPTTAPAATATSRPPTAVPPPAISLTPWPTHTGQPTSAISATATAASCPGAPPIRLAVGKTARVSLDPPLPSRVRELPGLTAKVVGMIDPGVTVTLLEGPRCLDNLTWWKVQSAKGLVGWTAEGDSSAYWLVP